LGVFPQDPFWGQVCPKISVLFAPSLKTTLFSGFNSFAWKISMSLSFRAADPISGAAIDVFLVNYFTAWYF